MDVGSGLHAGDVRPHPGRPLRPASERRTPTPVHEGPAPVETEVGRIRRSDVHPPEVRFGGVCETFRTGE